MDALESATCVFWTEGYEAASIDMLCRAMNMPRASLYQIYGDKERLFQAAIDHYAQTRLAPVLAALGPRGTLKEDLEAFFDRVIEMTTSNPVTRGCLISSVLSDAAGSSPIFRDELNRRFSTLERHLAVRLTRSPEASIMPKDVLAGLLASIANGMTLRARSGATAEELRPVGRAAAALVS